MFKYLIQFLILATFFAIPFAIVAYGNSKRERQCSVSVFPVQIQSGNQCPYQWVATGFDADKNQIACGQINVSCK